MQKKSAIWLAVIIGILVLSGIIWIGLWPRLTGETTKVADTTNVAQPPVLPAEIPALAGNVLVGTKVPTKFYLTRTGRRYVFPEETKTLETWFPVNPPIKNISQDELEKYPLGGNVWYRPGVRLIHISTDPHIYAVAAHGVLRAIPEDLAAKIFGEKWKQLLDLMPDYYFTNYKIGAPIATVKDYSIADEQNAAATMELNLNIK